ncbi:TPA: hypothetical protein DIV55_06820 [Patescibacteria group bacterium]|uniref:ATPase, BadF/BadG/BcrA/BcrD type n=1 Tax=Candidatus Gottesmanbacteria bacterium GW2011_GWA1_43_11 TaxID=1618436 RepID=A0A0G1FEE8_9BACT|nr:MAG: ATPase, BadF/BadG/BcrA/BcrD type [Candidatus Gottesmanbacteria bacterium GW2011_GWA1_43_11]HCS79417.1 hypothetical protein [Patescibacteria group bacterium]
MNYLLGVDAGGTKTKAVIIDENSNLITEALGGPANYHNIGLDSAVASVTGTITQILKNAKQSLNSLAWATVGIAGCDSQKDFGRLQSAFTKNGLTAISDRFTLVNDTVIGLYSGTVPPGIVVICGTGSNVYGENDHGEKATAGNWGQFLGDKGSGYSLGKHLFETSIEVYDGIITESTVLTELLEKRLGVKSAVDINDWYSETHPSVHEISDFAPLVIAASEEGDELAKQLVEAAIAELGKALVAVVKRLKMEDEPIRVVICGGLFQSKYFRTMFEGHATALVKRIRIIKPLVDAAVGAALMGKLELLKSR